MAEETKLLSPATNFAVVQLPDRKFPGVVFQGDSLYSLFRDVQKIRQAVSKYDDEDLHITLLEIDELLAPIVGFYEKTCKDQGIDLPYMKNSS